MKNFFGILKHVRGYWRYAALNIVFNILSVLFSLFSLTMIAPFLELLFLKDNAYYAEKVQQIPEFTLSIGSAVDVFYYKFSQIILDYGKLQALLFICLLVVIIIFFKNLFRYLGMFFLAPVRNGVVKDLRNRIFGKVLQLPLSYYSDERKGDIMSRMTTDVQEIEWSIMNSLEMIFRDPLTILLCLGGLIFMSPGLTLLVFALLPVSAGLIVFIAKSLKRTSGKAKEKLGMIFSTMEETLSGLRIIKAFNAEGKVEKKFQNENEAYASLMMRMYRKVDLASPLSEFVGVLILIVILYFGGKLALGSDPSIEGKVLITYIAFFYQLIPPSRTLTTAYYNIQKGLASSERINKILEAEITIRESPNAIAIKSFDKEIIYKEVSFAYIKGDTGWVLQDIDLKVNKGKTIALVGQSGSGKTTLADMLPRFYDPTKGSIFIDGISTRQLKIADLRDLIGIVTQESILFNDTVFNNIAFVNKKVGEEEVIEAAKIANAHEFIMQMPQAYQSNIGDRGGKLSGGQRQRLSIARAVLKNPPILILDEATSALDTESERLVQDALSKLMQNRTSIVIAHRLSTIQHADEIIVMQKGEIIERGTHHVLLNKQGTYRKLYDLQSFV